jgi:hypothetical protein
VTSGLARKKRGTIYKLTLQLKTIGIIYKKNNLNNFRSNQLPRAARENILYQQHQQLNSTTLRWEQHTQRSRIKRKVSMDMNTKKRDLYTS